ncbi:cell division protein FtsI [Nocardioides psychrotolerans]|uniref:Cell division protein FtsI/penicillin-binding protein 2 n=1 Tax=Nocardioides psychrotolerans TaxID=1005945 RepID=A0A1I3G9H7_9ACTN|nr:penicillin-binding transpeptidase domain-containing protein [Nocardioides psychrotolerans]GEP39958.1 cell division protein FtsI [Nocardioides psychrotolerans]SFI20057.1 Cell division protein FtsI/penicillin-binding protein 2 [Nocardioides psychrotolerans]
MRSRLACLTVLVLLTAGCTSSGDPDDGDGGGPAPDEAAVALASALVSGELADVPFFEQTSQQVSADYTEVVEGMGDLQPTVEAGEVDIVSEGGGDRAVATLTWSWPVLEGTEWTYDSEAGLALVGQEWQVLWARTVVEPSIAGATTLDLTPIRAARGDITGARGLALVTPRPVLRLGIDRSMVPAARAGQSAQRLARLIGIDVAAFVERVEAAGELAFVEAIVYRADEVPADVGQLFDQIRGARAIGDEVPLAPTREFAAPILGTVGEVTAEMVEQDPERFQPGDQAGLSGLQARYDEQLQGTPGAVVNAVSSDGVEREVFRVDGEVGTPLELTLDLDLQVEAERLLADVGPSSAVVAIRPSSGAIVAAANGPGTEGLNIATFGQFAPGSTFKSVSTLALLRAGLTPDTVVPCTPTITVDGKSFKNYSDYPSSALGRVTFRTALANSCNTALISQRGKLGELDLFDAAAALGMGIDHDLGFPAYLGQVEPAASETEKGANLIGQGRVLASPMSMATVIASVQRGDLVIPSLLPSVEVTPPDVEPITGTQAGQLRSMLRSVVTSGSGAGLLDVPGPEVIAKTGTAEFERGGRLETHAWMIAAQGDLAVAVFVEVGASGSRTAGPILEAFLRAAR